MKQAGNYLVYLFVRLFICAIQTVRIETCAVAARLLAFALHDVIRIRRQVVEDNLLHSLPHYSAAERQRVARQMWEHLLLMVCEIAHAPRKLHETNWRDYVDVQGLADITRNMTGRRATVIVSGHYGNFELAGYITGLLGYPSHTIARVLDNPYLNRFVNQFRGAHGQFILPKKDSAHAVQDVLESGGILTLLGDQYAGPKGCWIDFLGRPASCHKAVALFSLANNAPMLVVYARRQGKPLHFELALAGGFDPETCADDMRDVKSITEWYTRRLEDFIRAVPEQYWWVHRRWKEKPVQRKKLISKAAA